MGRTPFESMLDTTLYVATDRAVREGRPMLVCRHERLGWTVCPAGRKCEPGYEPLAAVGPGDHTDAARRKIADLISREHPMGAAKKVYTARHAGQHVEAGVLRAFAGAPNTQEPKRAGDDLPGVITSHETAQRYGPTPPVAYTDPGTEDGPAIPTVSVGAIPSEIQSPDDYCTLCGGPAAPCKSLCLKALDAGQRVRINPIVPTPLVCPDCGVPLNDPALHIAGCWPQRSLEPSTMPQDTPAPVVGPYAPSPSATRHKRSQKAPAKGQKSLFD